MADSYFDDMLSEARSSFIEGNYKVAEPLLQQMVLQNTRNPEVFQMLATIAYDKGQFNKAIKTFKRALEIDPTYTDASVGLSIILNDLGRYEEGRQIFDEAKQLLDRRKGEVDPGVDEKIAAKHEELADLYLQHNRISEALEQLLKAHKLSSRKAELTLRVVECHIKLGELDRATKDLKSILKDYPHFTAARLKLGVLMYNRGQVAEATEQWENILIRDPENPEALKYLNMAQSAGITSLSL
jgi:tetratricopeptide (TPR) repeat protein